MLLALLADCPDNSYLSRGGSCVSNKAGDIFGDVFVVFAALIALIVLWQHVQHWRSSRQTSQPADDEPGPVRGG